MNDIDGVIERLAAVQKQCQRGVTGNGPALYNILLDHYELFGQALALLQQYRWRSVEDELPTDTGVYIAVRHDVDVFEAGWQSGLGNWLAHASIGWDDVEGVTHWMPLPSLPKGESK